MKAARFVVAAMLAAGAAAAAQNRQQDMELQAAIRTETVDGDLNGAIRQYGTIVSKYKSDRGVTAMALVHMAECYRKQGDAESRKIYDRVLRDYADQKEAVALARARLGLAASARAGAISTRRLWIAPRQADFYGKVSADGRYVPYTDWAYNGDLFVHDFHTGSDRRVTDVADDRLGGMGGYAEEAAFSRDSKHLAYTWSKRAGVELRVVALEGSGIPKSRALVVNAELQWISPYDWSPDGRHIAVLIQRNDHTAQIGLVSVQDGSLRVLKSVDWRGPYGIFFSLDGKYLAYDIPAADATGQRDIFVLATDGNREVPAVVHPSRDSIIGWSPDGTRLIFASDRSGSMGLWSLPFENGSPQAHPALLKADAGAFEHLGISASGVLFSAIYDPGGVPSDIHVAGFDLETGRFLSDPEPAARTFPGTNFYPSWSPDGKHIAYVSMRRSYVAIGIRSMETGEVRELIPSPNFPAYPGQVWSLSWARDGRSFILSGRGDKHGSGIFRVDARTGQTSLIVARPRRSIAVLSGDGATLYYRTFASDNDDSATFVRRDLVSGEEKELYRGQSVGFTMTLSREGRYLAVTDTERPGGTPSVALLIPTAGGKARELLRRPTIGALHFSPDGRYIAVAASDSPAPRPTAVLLVPVEGGEPREIVRVPDSNVVVPMAWTPNSHSVLFKKSFPSGDKAELWRVSVEGGQPHKLDTNIDRIASSFLVSPDGTHVAFTTPRSEKKPTEIWVTENFLPPLSAKR